MTPAMIGTSISRGASGGDEVEVVAVVEEELRDQEGRPVLDLRLQVREVGLEARRLRMDLREARSPDRELGVGVADHPGQLGRAAETSLGLNEVGLPAWRVASQGEDVLDPRVRNPVDDFRLSAVSPTQLRCAIASTPYSSLIARVVSRVPRVAPPAPYVTEKYAGSSSRSTSTVSNRVARPSSVFGGKYSTEKQGRVVLRISSMRTWKGRGRRRGTRQCTSRWLLPGVAAKLRTQPWELNRALLARQMLLERERISIPKALERMGTLQAQYAPSMYIGLWTRLDGFEREDLTAPWRTARSRREP